ncbi:hypothetical protein BOTBODRAFT_65809 [Botryobasidium botryosum FD-172 SS1]|uniref:Uncharacterized protein n=1 Tax=Botryobasidium botryosum (strain FD-172 SS1) TaxID=930990 RepID=A0A067MTG4_BOTB1|nr:hypothetical protein BOTBODRAFT_65809 [Botryobasidium botryosum FD-172 SS1]
MGWRRAGSGLGKDDVVIAEFRLHRLIVQSKWLDVADRRGRAPRQQTRNRRRRYDSQNLQASSPGATSSEQHDSSSMKSSVQNQQL